MHALRFVFSPSGRLSPQTFLVVIVVVYLAGAASYALTRSELVARGGLWLFVAAQAVLIWIWFALHARRLRDGGRGSGVAAGVGILYALSIVLLVMVFALFSQMLAADTADPNSASALILVLYVSVIAILLGAGHQDLGGLVVTILLVVAFAPTLLTFAVSLWAATRPSATEHVA